MDDYRRYRQKPPQDPNAARNELFGGPQRQPNYPPPPNQYPPPPQYGGAPQNPYGGGYGQNSYGGQNPYGAYPPPGGYSPYGQQRTEEEEVDEIKTQIRQTKLDSLQSTQNSLAAIQRAEQSAQTTLNKLGEQSQRIDYTEKQLELAAAQAEVAQAKASKLKKVNGSMFGFDIGLPFTKNREKSEMKKVVALQSQQQANKEQRQQGNWESQQRVYDAMQTVSKNNNYQPGRNSDRSRFQFEADEEDEQIENRLDSNLDQISNGLSRLQAMAIASGQEVQRQTAVLDRISDNTTTVNTKIAHTTHTLKNIK